MTRVNCDRAADDGAEDGAECRDCESPKNLGFRPGEFASDVSFALIEGNRSSSLPQQAQPCISAIRLTSSPAVGSWAERVGEGVREVFGIATAGAYLRNSVRPRTRSVPTDTAWMLVERTTGRNSAFSPK